MKNKKKDSVNNSLSVVVTNRHDTQNDDIRGPLDDTETTSKKSRKQTTGVQSAFESSYGPANESEPRLNNKS